MAEAVHIGDLEVAPGTLAHGSLPVARLPTGTMLELPLAVANGKHKGPALFVCAAIHGDEINGVDVIRRLLGQIDPARLRGTLYAIPIVNVFGFIHQSRYLPDRRDLNRSFPGSSKGSLASRLARLFSDEIVSRCDYGIDLHTGAVARSNHPQIRGDLDDARVRKLARAFAPPLLIHAEGRPGSLRLSAARAGVPVLVFEGGEALRFSRPAIEMGVKGVRRVMAALKMTASAPKARHTPVEIQDTAWVRARRSGIFRTNLKLGTEVTRGDSLGILGDPFGRKDSAVRAPHDGIIIGRVNSPLVNRGDALIHLGR